MGDKISFLDKTVENNFVSEIILQISLGNSKSFKLFSGIIVVGNLWESKWLFVNITCFYQNLWFIESFIFNFISHFDGFIQVFFV